MLLSLFSITRGSADPYKGRSGEDCKISAKVADDPHISPVAAPRDRDILLHASPHSLKCKRGLAKSTAPSLYSQNPLNSSATFQSPNDKSERIGKYQGRPLRIVVIASEKSPYITV
jgi:hypothetical protein